MRARPSSPFFSAHSALLFVALHGAACSDSDPTPRRLTLDATAPSVDVPTVDAQPDVGPSDVSVDAPDATPTDRAPTVRRVLFVGNSYTYVNDLPAALTAMAQASADVRIEAASVTVGGATLRSHWTAQDAPNRIMAGGWNAVVIQGQSVEPALNPTDFRTYADRFGTLARDFGARAVFFATWPRRAGDAVYAESWSGGSPEVFARRLDEAYTAAAMRTGGATAHVGLAFLTALRARPVTVLWADDGSHPSPAGTWVAACVLYRAITDTAPPAAADGTLAGVSADEARALREAVATP